MRPPPLVTPAFLVLLLGAGLALPPVLADGGPPAATPQPPESSAVGGCPHTELYCTAKVDSQTCLPELSIVGCPSGSAGSGFKVIVSRIINTPSFAHLMYSTTGTASTPFQGGFLCLGGEILKTPPLETTGPGSGAPPCTGHFLVDFNAFIAGGSDPNLVAGSALFLQWWYFDPGTGIANSIGLSRGLATFIDV